MVNYELPTSLEIDGTEYDVTKKGDYRVILDIISILHDNDLAENEKAWLSLLIFYGEIPDNAQCAMDKMMQFINCGEPGNQKNNNTTIMNWEQDFHLLVSPINRVLNCEIRALEYLHWWTFVSAYMEIGECTFANVVSIRRKRQKGTKLDKSEQEFFRDNSDMIILKSQMSQEEIDFLEDW